MTRHVPRHDRSRPYPFAEERRLFYVALTRARRQAILIGVEGKESAFVAELLDDKRLELSPLSTVDLSEPCPRCGQGVLVVRKRRADGASSWPAARSQVAGSPAACD